MKSRSLLTALVLTLSVPTGAEMLNPGDEPSATRTHSIQSGPGKLSYSTTAGRLPIRSDESDEPQAHIFYAAYNLAGPKKPGRPVAFIWGGGPGGDSLALQHELMGPRLVQGDGFVDNPDTLLSETDLVFVDAVGTGFSRAAKPEFAPQFYSMAGDTAAMSEFIRSYLALNGDTERPIYVGGQSLGTWRAANVGEILARAGYNLKGIMIFSGQIPGTWINFDFDDAMSIPSRTQGALFHRKLDPELQGNPQRTMEQVRAWARDVYWPALERKARLTDEEREAIARQLARFTGIEDRLIDRRSLTMTTTTYRRTLFGSDPASVLSISDYTIKGPTPRSFALRAAFGRYFRDTLGYRTGLAYTASGYPVENSFLPSTSLKPHRPVDWIWDVPRMSDEGKKRLEEGYSPSNAPPWMQNALRANPSTRIFIAAGELDPMVSCLGNSILLGTLEPELAKRYTNKCYFGGHSIYRSRPEARTALLNDLKAFIRAGESQ